MLLVEVEAKETLFFPKWFLLWMFYHSDTKQTKTGIKRQGVLMLIKTNSSYGSCPEEKKQDLVVGRQDICGSGMASTLALWSRKR